MSHLPRKPVRMIEHNQELLSKSIAQDSVQSTDLNQVTDVAQTRMTQTYRRPPDREDGNALFRRYPNGSLDVAGAAHKVIDAIHKVRDGMPLTPNEQTALSCCFPMQFSFVDSGMSASTSVVNLRLAPHERMAISAAVARHLMAEMEFMLSSHAR